MSEKVCLDEAGIRISFPIWRPSHLHRRLNRKERGEEGLGLPACLLDLGHWFPAIHAPGSSRSKAVGLGLDLLQLSQASSFQREVTGLSADIAG